MKTALFMKEGAEELSVKNAVVNLSHAFRPSAMLCFRRQQVYGFTWTDRRKACQKRGQSGRDLRFFIYLFHNKIACKNRIHLCLLLLVYRLVVYSHIKLCSITAKQVAKNIFDFSSVEW